jgi:hypothetical protein
MRPLAPTLLPLRHPPHWKLIAGVAAWLVTVGAGIAVLMAYENAPGPGPAPPSAWPGESRIPRTADRPILVFFAHPHCPCTRASLGELARILARCQGRVSACVLLVKPDGVGDDWTQTDLRKNALEIPGVQVLRDDGGAEARRFHAATSGQTLLYAADGRLLFHGGITPSRGHAGDSSGRTAILALVNGATKAREETFVFGCPLSGKALESSEGNPRCHE